MADGGTCTMFSKGPVMVAELMAILEAMRAEGVPPCWSGYVSTDDVDARRVEAAGGCRMLRQSSPFPAARCSCSSSRKPRRSRSLWRR